MSQSSSIRLTDDLRRKVRDILLKDKFKEESEGLYVEAAKLAVDAHKRFYMDQRIYDTLMKLPDGWLPTSDYIQVSFTSIDNSVKLHFNGYSRFLPWVNNKSAATIKLRFRQYDLYASPHLLLPATADLSKRYAAIVKKSADIEEKKEKLLKDVNGVLWSATTTGKLIALWPEIEPIIAPLAPINKPMSTLPAKILTDLNKQLGLTAKKAA